MLTVIHSKEEERNEVLFNWLSSTGVLSDQCDLNLGDLVISTKLTSASNECKSYQLNISKNNEKVSSSMRESGKYFFVLEMSFLICFWQFQPSFECELKLIG